MLAHEVGVGVETIRFYERKGLLPRPRKTAGPRHYDEKALATVRYIKLAQKFGLSLKEISSLQGQLNKDASFCHSLQEVVEAKLTALAAEAAEIIRLQDELNAFLARCRTRNPALPCPIVAELTQLDHAVSNPSKGAS
jgi:MerR family mercuric resistance operon transcriptional regulator